LLDVFMNRKKKINTVYSQKAKKDKRKNQPSTKNRYISKADRAAAEAPFKPKPLNSGTPHDQ
jgi:hypothetical protein